MSGLPWLIILAQSMLIVYLLWPSPPACTRSPPSNQPNAVATAPQSDARQRRATLRRVSDLASWGVPPVFDGALYRMHNPSLANFSDVDAAAHYEDHGRRAGLRASAVTSTSQFVALLRQAKSVLEVGPYCRPLVTGRNVKYADVLDQAGLQRRLGNAIGTCPVIDYVVPDGRIAEIPAVFDALFSSHNIEHQVDLVRHLQVTEDLLVLGGRLFLVVPDRRFMFDNSVPPTTIADVLDAYYSPTARHTLKSILEHRSQVMMLPTLDLWSLYREGRSVSPPYRLNVVQAALHEWLDTPGYIDVHKWNFTPESFTEIVRYLHDLHLTNFTVERVYPTLHNDLEFRAVLKVIGG